MWSYICRRLLLMLPTLLGVLLLANWWASAANRAAR